MQASKPAHSPPGGRKGVLLHVECIVVAGGQGMHPPPPLSHTHTPSYTHTPSPALLPLHVECVPVKGGRGTDPTPPPSLSHTHAVAHTHALTVLSSTLNPGRGGRPGHAHTCHPPPSFSHTRALARTHSPPSLVATHSTRAVLLFTHRPPHARWLNSDAGRPGRTPTRHPPSLSLAHTPPLAPTTLSRALNE